VVKIELNAAALGGQASGAIQSRYNANVGFLVSGRLVERLADVSSVVKKGDIIPGLDPADY
jgi:membrane fusion protein, multidrug efflux system